MHKIIEALLGARAIVMVLASPDAPASAMAATGRATDFSSSTASRARINGQRPNATRGEDLPEHCLATTTTPAERRLSQNDSTVGLPPNRGGLLIVA